MGCWNRVLAVAACWLCSTGQAADASALGRICLLPFADQSRDEPMLLPQPGPGSRYTFRLDGKTVAEIGIGESARIAGLPLQQTVKLQVLLGGKPTETLRLRLEPARAVLCLRLAPGYANWREAGVAPADCDC